MTYGRGTKNFRPDKRFNVREIKQLSYFSIQSPLISTHINLAIDGAIYTSQYFPFAAAYAYKFGNFWTHLCISTATCQQ